MHTEAPNFLSSPVIYNLNCESIIMLNFTERAQRTFSPGILEAFLRLQHKVLYRNATMVKFLSSTNFVQM